MRNGTLTIIAAIALTCASTLISLPEALANDVTVIGSFARASATPQATSATVYLTIANHGAGPDSLLAVTTPSAAMAHLHQSRSSDGVMSMVPVDSLELPPGSTVEMSPGGLHIMLMGLKSPLKEGGHLELQLSFSQAGKLAVQVPIKGVAATGP